MTAKALERLRSPADITSRGEQELVAFSIEQGNLLWSMIFNVRVQTNGYRRMGKGNRMLQ